METLWRYQLDGALTNKNAGYSMWGFGRLEGTWYFIKQFLSPKYPAQDTESSPERLAKRRRECQRFTQKKVAIYQALNAGSDGNDVRVREFFRVGSRFYIAMDKVDALPWTVESIAGLEVDEIRRLCAIISHAIAGLHREGLVHADIKHDNILYTKTSSGLVTAKVIDFDNSFLESDPPGPEEEIVGDFNYFAPETCARVQGAEQALTTKIDVFALGVLFHQYFSGCLPAFEDETCVYPGDAVLRGFRPRLALTIPEDVAPLLLSMLEREPEQRPTAWEVYKALASWADERPPEAASSAPAPAAGVSVKAGGSPFYRPGDL